MEGEETMRAAGALLGAVMVILTLATPAFALEDGIIETSSMGPSEDGLHVEFERTITNSTGDPIAVAPRDLRMGDSMVLIVVAITGGSFSDGIWTVGTLEGGQTASIAYADDAITTTTTTTAPITTTMGPSPTTTVASTASSTAAPTTAAPEELPLTGPNDRLGVLAIVGVAMIGLGAALLRTAQD